MATIDTCPCRAKAQPDEPVFTLLARDKFAPMLVRLWAAMREADGKDEGDARVVACEMVGWRKARVTSTGGILPAVQPEDKS